jgi:peptidoglycan hydrolase-like protein with peptidoglycan-binding domain
VVTVPTFIPGCGNLNVGFSTVTGQSCANNATLQQTPIAGCGNSNTGFSTVSGVSCAGNPVSVNIAGTGVDDFNFGTANLLSGSKGEEVVELQTFLNRFNNAGLATDGDFGPKTKLAVMKWQSGHNLVSDGVVGPKSKAEMQSWASTH